MQSPNERTYGRTTNWGTIALGGTEGRGVTTYRSPLRELPTALDAAVRAGARPVVHRLSLADIQEDMREVGCVSDRRVCSCRGCLRPDTQPPSGEWTLTTKRQRRAQAAFRMWMSTWGNLTH